MKLGTKLLAISIGSAAFALIVGVLFFGIATTGLRKVVTASVHAEETAARAALVRSKLQSARTELFRGLVLSGSLNEQELVRQRAAIVQGLTELSSAMKAGQSASRAEPQAAAVSQAAALIDKFGTQVSAALELGAADINLGAGAGKAADHTAAEIENLLASILREETSKAESARALVQQELTKAAQVLGLFSARRHRHHRVGGLAHSEQHGQGSG